MKYRITPFNLFAVLLGLGIAWYFIHPHSDPEGWGEFGLLYYVLPFAIALLIIDCIMQLVFYTKKYRWFLLTEGIVLLVIITLITCLLIKN